MPKYHFDTRDGRRLTVKYTGDEDRDVDLFHGRDRRVMNLHTFDSLIAIDYAIPEELGPEALNKMHLEIPDEYEFTPHAERSTDQHEGHRLDLAWVDRRFASEMLERVKRWKNDPDYRLQLASQKYGGRQYSHKHRRTQLCLSETGVEEMIKEILGWRKASNIYVSNLTRRMIQMYFQGMGTADHIIRRQTGKTRTIKESKPFVIRGSGAKDVLEAFDRVYDSLHRTLVWIDRESKRRGFMERIGTYWDWVDAWAQR